MTHARVGKQLSLVEPSRKDPGLLAKLLAALILIAVVAGSLGFLGAIVGVALGR
jgi:hypothetical protein